MMIVSAIGAKATNPTAREWLITTGNHDKVVVTLQRCYIRCRQE